MEIDRGSIDRCPDFTKPLHPSYSINKTYGRTTRGAGGYTASVRPKPPSSLDYDDFLHELALKNWNHAMLEADGEKAETNAKKLAASHEKFWRFVGHIHVYTSRLNRGQATLAIDALADAARVFAEPGEIAAIAKSLQAHIHLETHSSEERSCRIAGRRRDSRGLLLARARLRTRDPWESPRATPSRRMCAPRSTLRARLASLQARRRRLRRASFPFSPSPSLPIRFAYASALEDAGFNADAEARFREITRAPGSLAYWPIPVYS